MQEFCIGVENKAQEMVTFLQNEFNGYTTLKKAYYIDEIPQNNSTAIVCKLRNNNFTNIKIQKSFRLRMCNAIAEFIIKNYESKILERVINSNYCYFTNKEKKDIINKAFCIVEQGDKIKQNGLTKRKNKIAKKLVEYFESEDSLILNGFINFRLKEYIEDLEYVAEKAVDQYLTEREYNEFLRLLKYFIEMQEPAYEVINIIVNSEGMYHLHSGDGKDITKECVREFELEMQEKRINLDDLLISTLVSLAPTKIIIHNVDLFKNVELLDTIKKVFDKRISFCSNCNLCKKNL